MKKKARQTRIAKPIVCTGIIRVPNRKSIASVKQLLQI